MQRNDICSWVGAILVIGVGAGECLFCHLPRGPLQQSPADRSAFLGKGNDLGGGGNRAGRGHASSRERRASLSHTRCCVAASIYRPMLAGALSSITPSSRSSAMPAFANRGPAAAVCPMTFRCRNASRIQSIAARFLRSGLIPSSELKIATASNNTEGAPKSAMSAVRRFPDFGRTPPILGRNDSKLSAVLFQCIAQSIEPIAVGAVRHKRADFSAFKRRLGLADKGEGGRLIEVYRCSVGRDLGPLPFHADRGLDRARQGFLDQRQMAKHAAPNDWRFNLRKLEGERVLDVPLFGRRHGAIELSRLVVMIGKAFRPNAQFLPCFALAFLRSESAKSALSILARAGRIEAVGLVGNSARNDVHPTHAVALQIPHRTARTVDRQLVKISAAEPADL